MILAHLLGLGVRHAGWAALLASSAVSVACSSSSNPPPDVFVNATMGVGAQSNGQMCPIPSRANWLNIGTPVGTKPTTVNDSGSNGMGTVSVVCVVHPNGSSFQVNLSAAEDGPQGASLTISSPHVTAQMTTGVSATFASPSGGRYSQSDCVITYTYNETSFPVNPPIAAGRIWGHISCPTAQAAGQTFIGPDGGAETRQCDAEADFLFEQCGE